MATDFRRKEQLPDLTDRIVASYHDIGSINHLGHCPLPSTEAVIEIAQDLKEVIFPGYRRRHTSVCLGHHHGPGPVRLCRDRSCGLGLHRGTRDHRAGGDGFHASGEFQRLESVRPFR